MKVWSLLCGLSAVVGCVSWLFGVGVQSGELCGICTCDGVNIVCGNVSALGGQQLAVGALRGLVFFTDGAPEGLVHCGALRPSTVVRIYGCTAVQRRLRVTCPSVKCVPATNIKKGETVKKEEDVKDVTRAPTPPRSESKWLKHRLLKPTTTTTLAPTSAPPTSTSAPFTTSSPQPDRNSSSSTAAPASTPSTGFIGEIMEAKGAYGVAVSLASFIGVIAVVGGGMVSFRWIRKRRRLAQLQAAAGQAVYYHVPGADGGGGGGVMFDASGSDGGPMMELQDLDAGPSRHHSSSSSDDVLDKNVLSSLTGCVTKRKLK